VPSGSYSVVSVAAYANGVSAASAPVSVTVANVPPSTTVLDPSAGASVSGTSSILDANASANVSRVTYELSGGPSDLVDQVIATGTPTYYGWLAEWNTNSVPNGAYSLQSVAYAGGESGPSASISITVDN
jgi:Rieske Fe-S protein